MSARVVDCKPKLSRHTNGEVLIQCDGDSDWKKGPMSKTSVAGKNSYRDTAHKCLERANAQLENLDDISLRYAAVELRLAIEALTYARAEQYQDDFPRDMYDVWQPRQVMNAILEINPNAFAPISFSVEFISGSGDFVDLGQERPLKPEDIKGTYDALGNYLHTPTLKQMRVDGGHKVDSIRARCVQMADIVATILNTSLFNLDFKITAAFNCLRCEGPFKVRVPHGNKVRQVTCPHCHAPYDLKNNPDMQDGVLWGPLKHRLECLAKNCEGHVEFWCDQIKPDSLAMCDTCATDHQLKLRMGLAKSA